MFTSKTEIEEIEDFDTLITSYNSKLYLPRHEHRKLMSFHDFVYLKGYAEDSYFIIEKLREMATSGIDQYTAAVDS